jgi:chromosome segregation ATPase
MTKQDLQKELKEKVREGVKPSDLKKLKKSKSADDIPTSSTPSLPRSKSQLEIPLAQQPNKDRQISSLQDELTTERKKVSLLREDLSKEQARNKNLADHILELRVDKIKEFSDYLEKKQELESELAENIEAGTTEITRLEKQLKTVNKKKLELQSQLGQELSKNAELEMGNYSSPYLKYALYSLVAILFTL